MGFHNADQRLVALARERSPTATLEVIRSGERVELLVDAHIESAAWSSRYDAGSLLADVVASRQRQRQRLPLTKSHSADHEGKSDEEAFLDTLKFVKARIISIAKGSSYNVSASRFGRTRSSACDCRN